MTNDKCSRFDTCTREWFQGKVMQKFCWQDFRRLQGQPDRNDAMLTFQFLGVILAVNCHSLAHACHTWCGQALLKAFALEILFKARVLLRAFDCCFHGPREPQFIIAPHDDLPLLHIGKVAFSQTPLDFLQSQCNQGEPWLTDILDQSHCGLVTQLVQEQARIY